MSQKTTNVFQKNIQICSTIMGQGILKQEKKETFSIQEKYEIQAKP